MTRNRENSVEVLGKPVKASGVSFGQGLFFVTVEKVYEQLEPFGLTRKGVACLLKALRVPAVRMPNGDRLVNLAQFQLAMMAVSRVGGKDFLVPGAKEKAWPKEKKEEFADSLDEYGFQEEWETVMAELYFAKRLDYSELGVSMRKEFHAAAQNMVCAIAASNPKAADDIRIGLRRTMHRDADNAGKQFTTK